MLPLNCHFRVATFFHLFSTSMNMKPRLHACAFVYFYSSASDVHGGHAWQLYLMLDHVSPSVDHIHLQKNVFHHKNQ